MMQRRQPQARNAAAYLMTVCAMISVWLAVSAIGFGKEPAEEFLQGLRDRGYYDLATTFLERAGENPLIDEEFRTRLDYELGVNLHLSAVASNNSEARDQLLRAADQRLLQYLTEHPRDPLAGAATSRRTRVAQDRATLSLLLYQRATDPAKKADLRADAERCFHNAIEIANTRISQLREWLTVERTKPPNERSTEMTRQWQNEYVETRMNLAETIYNRAELVRDNSDAYRQAITEAAGQFSEISEKYHKYRYALYAVAYEGRCHQLLNDTKKALSFYDEIIQLDNSNAAILPLKLKTLQWASEIWNSDDNRQYQRTIDYVDPLLSRLRPDMAASPDAQGVRLQLSKALVAQAESLKGRERNKVLLDARKHLITLSKHAGEFQREATLLLSSLSRTGDDGDPSSSSGQVDGDAVNPLLKFSNFPQAKEATDEVMDELAGMETLVRIVTPKLQSTSDEDRRREMQAELDRAEAALPALRRQALHAFRSALQLAGPEISSDEVNSMRANLAYLYLTQGQYLEAAVIADFVVRRFADHAAAPQTAQFALKAYLELYAAEPNEEFQKEWLDRASKIAQYTADRWPRRSESIDARVTLINIAITQQRFAEAQQQLQLIPADSDRRGTVELTIGQALWVGYLRAMQERREGSAGNVDQPTDPQLEEMKTAAEAILQQGIERMQVNGASETLIRATLALADLKVDTSQFDDAIQLLEDPATGPLTLANNHSPLLQGSGLTEATYRTALRAAIARLPEAADPQAAMTAAINTMDQLRQAVGDTPEGRKRLVAVYIHLAADLRKQMELATPEVRRSLAEGFELFLRQVGEGSTETNVLSWVAETFFSLGEGFASGQKELPPEAKTYLNRALESYQRLLEHVEQAPETTEVSPEMADQIRARIAAVLTRLGQFKNALDTYQEILSRHEMWLHIQIEAARVYQQGAVTGKPSLYDQAVLGGRPNAQRQNIIWGWNKIANIAARQMLRGPEYKTRFAETFFEARYNLAYCRYQQAMREAERREELLTRAEQAIAATARNYPNLDNGKWRTSFDQLLKTIQQLRGQAMDGLRALR
ncbi:MAG: hypothetical protein R3E01_23450 [Pirellulaceae bacterium]